MPTLQGKKIVHCPSTVGGNPQGLAMAERDMGLNSRSITLTSNYLNYAADEIVFRSGGTMLENEIRRWLAVAKVLLGADIIHYNFGETLAPSLFLDRSKKYASWKLWLYNNLYAKWFEFLDLRLARLLGKVITVTYQGDDARQGDYCAAHYPLHFCREVGDHYYTPETDADKRRRIAIFDRYAHFIYAVNPDLLNVLPRRAKFLPYASVNPRDWKISPSAAMDKVRIVHAPSHRGVKGTHYIVDTVEKLRQEGFPIEFTLIEGMSNNDARKIYATADLLIDQLLAGYYGALAVELMALGKPVICYMRDEDLHHMPEEMRKEIPVIQAAPDTLYDVLKLYITDKRSDLPLIGVRGRAYAEKWHDPAKIATAMHADILSLWTKGGA